jgi:hypothetical protein
MKRSLFSLVAALALLAALAVPVAAHTQTVTPPGQDETIISRVLARPWIQAHCQSAAPAVTAGASDGVVAFSPEFALCGPVLNPGGQTTGP